MGDSAALFAHVPAKRKVPPEVQALTEDHRLTNPSERRRLSGTSQAKMLCSLCQLEQEQTIGIEMKLLQRPAACQPSDCRLHV